MEIFAGLVIGFIGSFHCVGMCGPIALALPIPNSGNFRFLMGRIIYNLGRITSYALMGMLFGFIGERLVISGFQQILSISLGILILVFVPSKLRGKIISSGIISKLINPLKASIGSLFRKQSHFSFYSIGFLNGFLPCGFVYAGLAGAISTGHSLTGMIFMIFFGLGTFPAMFAVSIFSKFIKLDLRKKLSRLIPVFAVFLAVLFIMRGMNLGIPYVSPKMASHPTSHHMINK